jgi:hypothetical protein
MADILSFYKINQLQLYIEHAFTFRKHPDIGKDCGALTQNDILVLDKHCRTRGIELVPSFASFGHLYNILKHPRYHKIAEDLSAGIYQDPEAESKKSHACKGWTLSPAVPETYTFLEEIFSELLPCFSSDKFNICCDETYDLGLGQSYPMVKKLGKGQVYLNHILKLNRMSKKYGKKVQFWGDIIKHYPELIAQIPKDVTVLDWGYYTYSNFEKIADFVKTGLKTYVCPSVNGYVSLFPRIHETLGCVAGWAKTGKKYKVEGFLNTDWGDGGHYNFMECAWHGYLAGADFSWNALSSAETFTERFCGLFFNIKTHKFIRAVTMLGDISHLRCGEYYQSIWNHIFFSIPGEKALNLGRVKSATCTNGRASACTINMNSSFGKKTIKSLEKIRSVFTDAQKAEGADPHNVLPYWIFSVDTTIHAARKLMILGNGGLDNSAGRKILKVELQRLRKRFVSLWMERNRKSEIEISLKKYDRAISGI